MRCPHADTDEVSLMCGRMALAATAVTHTTGDVESVTISEEPLPGIRQSVYRAELHAVARALEECSPHEV
eukprot:3314294-Amphidinium_carterae.1